MCLGTLTREATSKINLAHNSPLNAYASAPDLLDDNSYHNYLHLQEYIAEDVMLSLSLDKCGCYRQTS